MKISEVMTTEVMTCKLDDNLKDCAMMMKELNVGAIPIVGEDNELMGIITDRDITIRAVAQGVNLDQAKAHDFMTPTPLTVSPETNIEDAAEMMADNQVRRLPVVQNGQLVGIISLGDLAVDIGEEEPELIEETLERISEPER